jgi:hypothetical protein
MGGHLRIGIWIVLSPVILLALAVLLASPTLEWFEHSQHRVPELDELVVGLVVLVGIALFWRRVMAEMLRAGMLETKAGMPACRSTQAFEPAACQSPPSPPLILVSELRI